LALTSTFGVFSSKATAFGVPAKLRYMGVAPASYWVIGGSPRISSIVRIMLAVVYCVLSTIPCRV
jgi:hypothetical protein